MKHEELKRHLIENSLPNGLIILQLNSESLENCRFIAKQYIDEYCKNNSYDKKYISSIREVISNTSDIFQELDPVINVIEVDTLDEFFEEKDITLLEKITDTFVICKNIAKNCVTVYEPFLIKLNKVINIHIEDYIKSVCPGLASGDPEKLTKLDELIKYLCENTNYNIFKIQTELDKIKLFLPEQQEEALRAILFSIESDIYLVDIFKIVNLISSQPNIMAWEKRELLNYIVRGKNLNFDPIGLANLILKNYKNMAYTNSYSKKTYSDLDMSATQFNACRKNGFRFTSSTLREKIKFLSEIDLKLKSSELDLTKDRLIDYIICKMN